MKNWNFAGWGEAQKIEDFGTDPSNITELGVAKSRQKHLGQWQATAICGNDITSSCLYVSALTLGVAGVLAPIALGLVAVVLFLFRKIYAEVGSALPLNGGTYTVLLNTTNKKSAAGAAVLTLLSYLATAVISATEAMHYLHGILPGMDVVWATIGLLFLFAVLNIVGLRESAGVALTIFIIHMVTLTLLVIFSAYIVLNNPQVWNANWALSVDMINPDMTGKGLLIVMFLGFSRGMLGISGFESSANFIEEQKEGVFPKTLRNMWVAVAIFNPLICLLAIGLVDLTQISEYKTSLLATMGGVAAGDWLRMLVSIDAVLVLSGAVLTSYVGVTGLVRRMSLDRCLPQYFLRVNSWRKTNHWIILAFFLFSCAIYLVVEWIASLDPKDTPVDILAGVYTLSFLCVMALYAAGNMLMKMKRARLPRAVKASWASVSVAFFAVIVGMAGHLERDKLITFFIFFGIMSGIVFLMLFRVRLMRLLLLISQGILDRVRHFNRWVADRMTRKIDQVNSQTIVYFTKGDDLAALNNAALYVLRNEQTTNMMVVHVYEDEDKMPKDLAKHLQTVDHLYPQLRIDFLAVKGKFGPGLIERLSRLLNIPKNYMFIGTPGNRFPFELSSLGGVRLVME